MGHLTAPLPAARPSRRRLLLQGVSLGGLLLASGQAAGAPFRSLQQALNAAGRTAPPGLAPQSGITAAQAAQLGTKNLAAAAARFQSLSQALAGAAQPATASVPNGLAPGGLQILTETGAQAPAQAPGTYDVTVTQTQALATLTWQSFNVGARTKLTFDQSAGGAQASSWVVINAVADPTANPSVILGTISAPGHVYILNRNGILFGAGSTLNLGALVAATADIASTQFGTDAVGQATFNLYGAQSGAGYLPTFVNGSTAAVTVAEGASIATPAPGAAERGGSVLLLGGTVANAGLISTPEGQTVLAAGTAFTLRQGSQGPTAGGNTTSTTLGSEVAALNTPTTIGGASVFTTGAVANSGIVVADQGDITLVGENVAQAGVLLSTTTVNTRGTIHLLTPTAATDPGTAASSIVLAPNSVTEILPEDDGATALDSQRAADVAESATLNAQRLLQGTASSSNPLLSDHNTLADQVGESRIEIAGGGTIDLQPGALALTPGGQVAVAGAGGVLVQSGATIDVSGSTSALLPPSVIDLLVNIQPYQLRDSAANRTGGLKSTNIYVDARTLVEIASGAYGPTAANPLGNIYTPGGLFEVGGYLGLVPHGIDEWTAIGGQVTLQSQALPGAAGGGSVTTQAGSVINLTGGTVTYQSGPVPQTYLQATDGQVYNANVAPGNLVYTGLYTGQGFSEARWGVHDTYVNPLLTPATIEDPSYVVGRDAGSLTVSANAAVLGGTVDAGVTLGQNQNGARPAVVSDPYLLAQNVVPLAGTLQVGDYATGTVLGGINANVAFTAQPLAPAAAASTVQIDPAIIAASGLARLAVTSTGAISVDAPITVADGGSVALAGVTIADGASITARGGSITLTNISPFGGQKLAPPAAAAGTAAPPAAYEITLTGGARLDARGVWTNVASQILPGSSEVAGEALVNGGSVTVQGVGGVRLAPGTAIDVSSGGALLGGGRQLTGAGGSITVVADIDPASTTSPLGTGAVTLGAVFDGLGGKVGGTLSVTVPNVVIGSVTQADLSSTATQLSPAFFQAGFGSYVVDGTSALAVLPGTQVTAAQPIYVEANGLAVPTGGDPSAAYTVFMPALFTPVRGADTAVQRGGASITLLSDSAPGSATGLGGDVTIGQGASLSVDPGQSITVSGRGQVTVLGALVAHAGTVAVTDTRTDGLSTSATPIASNYLPGLSVWIGAGAVIDVSGQANVFTDAAGRSFGSVSAGGTVELGGYGGLSDSQSTWAQVIVRPGAVVDADGAAARLDVVQGDIAGGLVPQTAPVTLASGGGTVVARSLSGIALDGTVTAAAGGPGASGGALYLSLDPIILPAFDNLPVGIYRPSEIVVSQARNFVQPSALQPGQATPDTSFGVGAISQAQITAGGFASVSLAGADFILFDGSVALAAPRAITLSGGTFGTFGPYGTVSVSAPYVALAGYGDELATAPALNTATSAATFSVQADLLDVSDAIYLGGVAELGAPQIAGQTLAPVSAAAFGFAQTTLASTGDIRFLGDAASGVGVLQTQGNLTLRAAQLYPVSGASEQVFAGVDTAAVAAGTNELGTGAITVQDLGGAAPASPYSVGGALALVASSVVQDGVVRAPEGTIRLGFTSSDSTQIGGGGDTATQTGSVVLGPGSVTSVSLYGQTVPYGGTVDGVSYLLPADTGNAVGILQPTLELDAASLVATAGATVDLRGGGTLSGAGFIAGRGGSVDVLRSPLLGSLSGAQGASGLAQTPSVVPGGANDPVYAILPGYQSAYAPAAGAADAGYSTPGTGAQITVGSGVPGLAPGKYTLLPAYYALLPGGYRVELTAGTLLADSTVAQGNFSVAAPVLTSVANTSVAADVPQAAIFTSGNDVRQLSQYDEESYNTFEATTATQFGAPRPDLPQDAKTLVLNLLPQAAQTAALPVLSFDSADLLKAPDPKAGGYGLTVEVNSPAAIDLVGPGDVAPTGDVAVDAAALSGLAAPRLIVGGTISVSPALPNVETVTGSTPEVTVMPHAVLQAGDVMLAATGSGAVDVQGGAVVSTIGAGPAASDLSQHFYFADGAASTAYPIVDVSNGQDVFLPTTSAVSGASITVGDGASLLAGGSLSFLAPAGTSVGIGQAALGGKYVSVAVSSINIGTLPDFSGKAAAPVGLDLSAAMLDTLLDGNAGAGVPAASQLDLTATQSVNIFGSVALNTQGTALVLNTPAIYGYGGPSDAASITAPSFTWNGVAAQGASGAPASANPGAQVAGSRSHVSGSLLVDANTITLGYGPQSQPQSGLELDRLLVGFGAVTFSAATEITANADSALSVFASVPGYGAVSHTGDLSLVTPLLTTDAAAILKVTAGGSLALASPGLPAPTAPVATLGGEIDLVSGGGITDDTAVALPGGRLTMTAQADISLGSAAHVDLAGRDVALFDQTAEAPGGTLIAESAQGGISVAPGAVIDVSSPGAAAGSASFTAAKGSVALDGTLLGQAADPAQSGGLSVIAGTLPSFDALNAALDAGGFFGLRDVEVASGDITVDTTVRAHSVSISADAGSIDITGKIDASGTTPGSISVSAGQDLTLAAGAVLDAHATATAVDSYGQPIDAENRAHVALTAAAGVLTLAGGTIDVSYPGEGSSDALHPDGNPQGQVVFNVPRLDASGQAGTASGDTYGDVGLSVAQTPVITGAASIALYAYATYSPTDAHGTIGQGGALTPPDATLLLSQVDADNTAFISGFAAIGAQRLGGLASYGSLFHVRPGVIIQSTAATHGDLTITGDLDFSGFRYDGGAGYGTAKTAVLGSGEPGAIVFRAADDLIVNGSVSDGFAPPPDGQKGTVLRGDSGWEFIATTGAAGNPLSADIILPSSLTTTRVTKSGATVTGHEVLLGAGSTFDNTRPISLNYAITITATPVAANTPIPFALTLSARAAPIPAGGWVATADITSKAGTIIYRAGTTIPGGTMLSKGDVLGAGTVLPVAVMSSDDQTVPAGTPLNVFAGPLTLAKSTAVLPTNALIPANAVPVFLFPDGKPIGTLELRPTTMVGKNPVQGLLYPLASLLPAGSLSWDMSFVAGANLAAANTGALRPQTSLAPDVLKPAKATADQVPGSLILDDQHDFLPSADLASDAPAFSVIRTGTGDLTLEAGGDFDQSSLYGIYTAGTQTSLGSTEADAPYQIKRNDAGGSLNRPLKGKSKQVLRLDSILNHTYAAYYPNGGGDVSVLAQGDLIGDVIGVASSGNAPALPSDAVGNWLWRQGGSALGQATSWWINYGTVVDTTETTFHSLQLTGFEGIGALGGGNVSVQVGGDAGNITGLSRLSSSQRGEGLVVAVGGSGRVLADGSVVLTGGGTETVRIGGTLNPLDQTAGFGDATNGDFIDLRGNISITAGAVGVVQTQYPTADNPSDPRSLDPFTPYYNGAAGGITSVGGPNVLPGDGTVSIETMRDLVLGGAGDPGRVAEESYTYVDLKKLSVPKRRHYKSTGGGDTAFSLWTDATSISLFSSGGNVTPTTQPLSGYNLGYTTGSPTILNDSATDERFVYPANLLVTAATGSIVYGSQQVTAPNNSFGLETAPAPDGQVAFLAGTSIFANGFAIDMSGAAVQGLSTPADPAYAVTLKGARDLTLTNVLGGGGTDQAPVALFALEADTPSTNLHAADPVPELFYAAGGDIVNLVSGQTITFQPLDNEALAAWYLAAKPVRIMAAQDIVSSGTRPSTAQQGIQQNQQALPQYQVEPTASGDLFLNTGAQSVSVVSAGRDILSGYFYVGGPGLLEVDAGRNLFEGAYAASSSQQLLDFGAIRSLGPLLAGAPASEGGADLAVLAGIGTGADYSAFANLYFDPADQANLALPIASAANAGKVQQTYTAQLTAWLGANYPSLSLANGALAAFDTLPQADQAVFVREAFFEELLASGRQYNDPSSRFFGSYARGRLAIDTLFPSAPGTEATPGAPAGYNGAITLLSGPVAGLNSAAGAPLTYDAGIAAEDGGSISVLDPGGEVVLGTAGGPAPGAGSGIIGNGAGDINVYANGSVLLGKSRIFTTGGGNILVWSSQGDINAGIGARTTVVYDPPLFTYDSVGDASITAPAPTNGAGIATLQSLPGVPPGDVDLIAPLGTIDAGEAGIRVSGNLNLAAARLANTANITVGGKTTGNAAAPSVSLGAVEAAGAAAGAATDAAQSTAGPRAPQLQPSVLDIEVTVGVGSSDEQRKRRG